MLYQFKMGAHKEFFLRFLNFMFIVFVFLIYKKVLQSTLIVNCNKKMYFKLSDLLRGSQLIAFRYKN